MSLTRSRILAIAFMLLAGCVMSLAQATPTVAAVTSPQASIATNPQTPATAEAPDSSPRAAPPSISSLQPLLDFKDSDIKFNLQALMNTLRDNRHEGWVLAAYPDPKTSRPLIGAGFSLDVPAREHVQGDPLNPNQFLEPSSSQLWEAAGLEPQRLQTMLEQYDRELSAWRKAKFRRKIRTHQLFPEICEEDAVKLLRISTIQAVHNARAYCRDFDQLTGPQQMALTQLVFQMGVNLEEFTQFLFAINHRSFVSTPQNTTSATMTNTSFASNQGRPADTLSFASPTSPVSGIQGFEAGSTAFLSDVEYWKAVQETLIHSDWARRYSTRAVSVIAMFDPSYSIAPWQAEAGVRSEVHPLHSRRRGASVHTASAPRRKSAARRTRKS